MEKVLKPTRLDVDPSATDASKQWKHWKMTFKNFLDECTEAAGEGRQPNKLRALINYISHSVYEYIDEETDYDACVQKLEELYCKPSNEIFARHCLATRKQEPGESLDEFLQQLRKLSKDGNYKNVTAEQYREEQIRDSFISGLCSQYIRQRLLENKTLTLKEAFDQASALDRAQKNSNAYTTPLPQLAVTHMPEDTSTNKPQEESTGENWEHFNISATSAAVATQRKNCGYCGGSFHSRQLCPAKEVACHHCGMKGHFAKVCRQKKRKSTSAALFSPELFAIRDNLHYASAECLIKGIRVLQYTTSRYHVLNIFENILSLHCTGFQKQFPHCRFFP